MEWSDTVVKADAGMMHRDSCTVLLVDDERAIRRFLARTLDRLGFRVIEAGDGEEALTAFRKAPELVDAVVTDLVMPRLGGRELVARLREVRPELPVVMMTAYDPTPTDIGSGLTILLQKPFRPEEFRRGMGEAMARFCRAAVCARRGRCDIAAGS